MNEELFLILEGEIVEESKANISPVNRGMMYGDGCFETLKCYNGKFLGWDLHVQRLLNGLNYLGMEQPFSNQELKEQVRKLLEKNHLEETEAMIRIQLWRKGERGYAPISAQANWMIQVSPSSKNIPAPYHLCVAEIRCIPSAALNRRVKLSNGLNYVMAAREARQEQKQDALMLTTEDYVSETTSANVFWIKEKIVYTPSEECDLLPGITRKLVMDVCATEGIKAEEGKFKLDDLRRAEAMFCCNSMREIYPVNSVGETHFDAFHLMLQKIQSGFEVYKKNNLKT